MMVRVMFRQWRTVIGYGGIEGWIGKDEALDRCL